MVRINIIDPRLLTDQHLIAEYNEILMLLGTVKRYPVIRKKHDKYVLGPGHITFFKDKLVYLKKRHELIKGEMRKRGFKASISIDLKDYPTVLQNDWKPGKEDYGIIKDRLRYKINLKPEYYTYYREHKDKRFYLDMLK